MKWQLQSWRLQQQRLRQQRRVQNLQRAARLRRRQQQLRQPVQKRQRPKLQRRSNFLFYGSQKSGFFRAAFLRLETLLKTLSDLGAIPEILEDHAGTTAQREDSQ
jgi:hypothetical protein